MNDRLRTTLLLPLTVLLNYLAQIPYYLHQYYFPYHLAPAAAGLTLLGATLAWFLIGYVRYVKRQRYAFGLLISFLAVQVLFYGHSIVLGLLTGGGVVAQLKTNSPFLLAIFSIGYLNFIVATYYLLQLTKENNNSAASTKPAPK